MKTSEAAAGWWVETSAYLLGSSGPAGQLFGIPMAKVKSLGAFAEQLRLKGRSLWKPWQQALQLQEGRA